MRVSIYYGLQSDIWVQSYASFNLLGASIINFEGLNILWSVIRHTSQKLWKFEFAHSFRNQFQESWHIMVRNQIFKSKVLEVWICHELPCSIFSVSIYYGPQSEIGVKSYGCFNLRGASIIHFKSLDILWAAIRHQNR